VEDTDRRAATNESRTSQGHESDSDHLTAEVKKRRRSKPVKFDPALSEDKKRATWKRKKRCGVCEACITPACGLCEFCRYVILLTCSTCITHLYYNCVLTICIWSVN